LTARHTTLARRRTDFSRRTVGEARAASAARHAFLATVGPEADAAEASRAVVVAQAKSVLPTLAGAAEGCCFADRSRAVGAARIQTRLERGSVRVEHTRAFLVPVAVDVRARGRETEAIEIFGAVRLNAYAKLRSGRAEAQVVLGTVTIQVTGHPAVDAGSVLAREAGDTIETCRATRRGLDAAHAFDGDVYALSLGRTVGRGVAGAATGEDAMLDRCAIRARATGLDADRTHVAVVVGVAQGFGGARLTQHVRLARRTAAPIAAHASAAGNTASSTRAGSARATTAPVEAERIAWILRSTCHNADGK